MLLPVLILDLQNAVALIRCHLLRGHVVVQLASFKLQLPLNLHTTAVNNVIRTASQLLSIELIFVKVTLH